MRTVYYFKYGMVVWDLNVMSFCVIPEKKKNVFWLQKAWQKKTPKESVRHPQSWEFREHFNRSVVRTGVWRGF